MNNFSNYREKLEAFSKEAEKDGCQILTILVSSDGLSHFNYAGNITPFNAIFELYQLIEDKYNARVAREQFKSFYEVILKKGDFNMGILEEINLKLDHILTALNNNPGGCSCKGAHHEAPVVATTTPTKTVQPVVAPTASQSVPTTPVVTSAPVGVPTTAPTYTVDQLAVAAGAIMTDPQKLTALQGLLTEFGVQSLPDLASDKYNAFAVRLRELGAQI